MNCYNGEKYLRETIDSVYAQTYKNWEIIFWDNASTDKSAEIAKSCDSKLRYFRGEKTIPLGAARNKALEQCRGEYIAFLDCDDLWYPEKLEKQIPLFNNAKIGIAICNAIYFYDDGHEKKIYKSKKPPVGKVFKNLLNKYYISIPTVVIRKQALKILDHWFDPNFNLIEEYDLFIRLSYYWELSYVDLILAKYRVHRESTSFKEYGKFKTEMVQFLEKCQLFIPNFFKDYSVQINKIENMILWFKVTECWLTGNYKSVRTILKPILFKDIKWFVLFSISFIPYLRKLISKRFI